MKEPIGTANAEPNEAELPQAELSAAQSEADSINKRLLEESKKYKERAKAAEKHLEEIKKRELEAEGKAKEAADFYKKRYEDLRGVVVQKEINGAIREHAAKEGCIDTDALIRLGDLSSLEYDEESGQIAGVDMFIDQIKQKRPYLFHKDVPNKINAVIPNGVTQPKQKPSLKELVKDTKNFKHTLEGALSKMAKR